MSNQTSGYLPPRRIAWLKGIQPPGSTGVPNQSSSFPKREGISVIRELDGVPTITDATILEVSNGTLTNPSPGIARLAISGAGSADGGLSVVLGHEGGVPGAVGVRLLRVSEKSTSADVGFILPSATTLVGLGLVVDFAHPTNDYILEFRSDPTGRQGTGPTVLATLALPATVRDPAPRRDLSVAIAAGVELGAQLRRTTGSGNSNPLRQIVALCELLV